MSDTPIYDRCRADFVTRHGHEPGRITGLEVTLAKVNKVMKDFTAAATPATAKKAAPRKAAAKKTTTRRKPR